MFTLLVNELTSNDDNITQLSIVTIGAGPKQVILSYLDRYTWIDLQYRYTVVKCFTSGFVNSTDYKLIYSENASNTLSDICHYISFH